MYQNKSIYSVFMKFSLQIKKNIFQIMFYVSLMYIREAAKKITLFCIGLATKNPFFEALNKIWRKKNCGH